MLLKETVVLRGARLDIELDAALRYRLRYGDLVEYRNGVKRVRGKETRYAFRSVEQLRYDFEQDVKTAGGSLG
ncbi:MAG: hypothetical protein ACT4P4_08080 [Betaproteobacteria bacterium]